MPTSEKKKKKTSLRYMKYEGNAMIMGATTQLATSDLHRA